jgi:hypothetical protein
VGTVVREVALGDRWEGRYIGTFWSKVVRKRERQLAREIGTI